MQKMIDSCVELGIFEKTLDQILIYISKLTMQRSENPILFTATTSIKMASSNTLAEVMETISTTILHHSSNGKIPFDMPAVHFINAPTLKEKATNVNANKLKTKSIAKQNQTGQRAENIRAIIAIRNLLIPKHTEKPVKV